MWENLLWRLIAFWVFSWRWIWSSGFLGKGLSFLCLRKEHSSDQECWWCYDSELDSETGFCSLEVKGTIVAHGVGFPTICKALDVGVEFYMAERRRWRQEYLAVSHTGEVTSKREDSFGPPEEDGKPQDVVESDLEPDDWGWGHFGSFATDAEIYAGVK